MRYWKFLNPDETINTVQSCSNDACEPSNAMEIDNEEFNDYLASLSPPPPPEPPRDFGAEIDELKKEIKVLKETKQDK